MMRRSGRGGGRGLFSTFVHGEQTLVASVSPFLFFSCCGFFSSVPVSCV